MGNFGDSGGGYVGGGDLGGGGFSDGGNVSSDIADTSSTELDSTVYSGVDQGTDSTNHSASSLNIAQSQSPEFYHKGSHELVHKVDSSELINMTHNHNLAVETIVIPEGEYNSTIVTANDVDVFSSKIKPSLGIHNFTGVKKDDYVEPVDDEIDIKSILSKISSKIK